MPIQPYLFFEGRCQEAIDFYRQALGAEVSMLMHYRDAPPPPPQSSGPEGCAMPAAMLDKVMHASLRIGDAFLLMSDGQCAGTPNFSGFGVSLTAANDAQAARWFAALGEGGEVRMPMGPTFFASSFGMCADRFGVSWMVIVERVPAQANA
jgi:PhnB protein